jgi:diaminohydroxyphosphoribosylaminopyrimidine deaminase / 5-amino-6-(5-phosphoribosylamino)uracil reductase
MNDLMLMQRCLELAALSKGNTAPNPMVGALLVYNDRIIGEGRHEQYGQAHAEVNCFEQVTEQDKHLISESVMYVSLEPCAHQGKTPPCAHRIIKEGVKKVVICNTDPFKQVDGRGIQLLREAGIAVTTGVLETEGAWLNRRFFTFHQQQRPYIILKWAQTSNGFFAPKDHSRLQMSNEFSTRLSHQWRRAESAIMVGFTTAMNDNPQLISRYGHGNQPLRIALDKDLRLPLNHHLLTQDFPTWIINQHKNEVQGNIHFVKLPFNEHLLSSLLAHLYQAQKLSLIVEGGAQLLNSFIAQNLWDEARVFVTPNVLHDGLAAPLLPPSKNVFETDLAQDKLHVSLNENNPYQFFPKL